MKTEVDVLGSPSLTVLNMVSMDVKQHELILFTELSSCGNVEVGSPCLIVRSLSGRKATFKDIDNICAARWFFVPKRSCIPFHRCVLTSRPVRETKLPSMSRYGVWLTFNTFTYRGGGWPGIKVGTWTQRGFEALWFARSVRGVVSSSCAS